MDLPARSFDLARPGVAPPLVPLPASPYHPCIENVESKLAFLLQEISYFKPSLISFNTIFTVFLLFLKFVRVILRKIIKIVATVCHILRLKYTKIQCPPQTRYRSLH